MARYSKTEINKTINHKTAYNTTIYSDIPDSDDDIFIITQAGDRLDLLANRFYGDHRLWWYIAQANNLNRMNVEPGLSLRVPSSTKYALGG